MNAWNQWPAGGYPTALPPGYGGPQPTAAPTIPTAPGIPPAAAAAAAAAAASAATVPYPAMPGFQAWPYAATPQAMTPWGAPAAAAAAAPAGQAAQWDQWNQWHQQYSQWQQQQYAAQAASTAQVTQPNISLATAKTALMQPTQTITAASVAPTVPTNTTTTPSPVSSNAKRTIEAHSDAHDTKKPRVDQPSTWTQSTAASNATKELEELSEAEKQFDEQFKNWEAQFDAWRQQNANHPDIEQYKAYEAKWASWREQLISRREQMKKKREKLTEAASSSAKPEAPISQPPLAQPPDPSIVMNAAATAATSVPHMYPGSYSMTGTPPAQYPYQQPPPQTQSQYMPSYGPPSTSVPSSNSVPPQPISAPTVPTATSTPPALGGPSEQPPPQQSEFLKGSSSNGIPGLDLLTGGNGATQSDVKTMPPVSFPSANQLPIQTPADSKPFDFPPPRQTSTGGFMGQNLQGENFQNQTPSQPPQSATSMSGQPTSSAPGQTSYSGMMQPPNIAPSGFPGQTQSSGGFQGPPSAGGGYPNFPGYNTSQSGSGAGYQGYHNQPYQTPTSGYQGPGYQPPPGGFQGQPPTGYPPPGNFPGQYPNAPPMGPYHGGYQSNGNFPAQNQGSGFQDQQAQARPGAPAQGGYPPYQQPPSNMAQGNQPFQPNQNAPPNIDQKKLPGLMDNVLPPFSERNKNSDSFPNQFPENNSSDRFNKNPNFPNDKFPNKMGNQDRFIGTTGKEKFGDKPPPKCNEGGLPGKDNMAYSLPKPKGYFSMQEMSVEEEYEKFHEYQQGGGGEQQPLDDDEKRDRRSRFDEPKSRGFDDSRQQPRFDKVGGRYEDNRGNRFEDSRPSRLDESRPGRFDDSKSSRFDGGRQSRFDGGRPSRFEGPGPNRFPQEDLEKEDLKRSFENEPKPPPQPLMGNMPPQLSPAKSSRPSRWGSELPQGDNDNREPPIYSGALAPPYGATPDGTNFRFAVIIDYNHSQADLGVPDFFDPLSVIDYTHGLDGIKVEESAKELRDDRPPGRSARVPSPHGSVPAWDKDARDDKSRWRDERGGGRSGSGSGKWNEPDSDRDRRSRSGPWDESRGSYDRPRSQERSRQSDRQHSDRQHSDSRRNEKDERDRRDRKDADREKRPRSRSPPRDDKSMKSAPPPPPPQALKRQETPIDDLLVSPGRTTRPPKIAIFLRGVPGSGKSYVSRLIKDKEVKNGGTAPRILSLDDYFMTDVEKEEVDPDTGRSVKKKIMEYEFEQGMEVRYRESLNKCFRKTVTDGYFPFIIIDANNDKVVYFDSMINFCKVRGFSAYVVELEVDVGQCFKRNIHKRSEQDIEAAVRGFEPTPPEYNVLDIRSLLQEAAIAEVDMEDSMEVVPPSAAAESKDEKKEDSRVNEKVCEVKKPMDLQDIKHNDEEKEDKSDSPAFGRFTISSKWDDLDSSCSKLDRLDGFTAARKPRPTIQDWLQIPEQAAFDSDNSSVGASSKKRVRWADVEEQSKQAKMKALGFVVGHTDWYRTMDASSAESKLTQTKYI